MTEPEFNQFKQCFIDFKCITFTADQILPEEHKLVCEMYAEEVSKAEISQKLLIHVKLVE
jgi:hypothetical protein